MNPLQSFVTSQLMKLVEIAGMRVDVSQFSDDVDDLKVVVNFIVVLVTYKVVVSNPDVVVDRVVVLISWGVDPNVDVDIRIVADVDEPSMSRGSQLDVPITMDRTIMIRVSMLIMMIGKLVTMHLGTLLRFSAPSTQHIVFACVAGLLLYVLIYSRVTR